MKRGIKGIIVTSIFFLMIILPMVQAGVGISWDRESALVPEKTKTCLTYKVYNPWPTDVYAQIKLSDELMEIVRSSDSEVQFIPKETSSSEAIPVTFCFKTPSVYEKDCLIGDDLICKKECSEELKIFEGEVEVIEMSENEAKISGAGGSKTTTSVSAPLRVRVQCVPHARNYSIVYGLVALIAGTLLLLNVLRSKRRKETEVKKVETKKETKEEVTKDDSSEVKETVTKKKTSKKKTSKKK